MKDEKNNETASEKTHNWCEWTEEQSDEKLLRLINSPPWGRELLDHAVFCRKCGDRIDAVSGAEFDHLTEAEKDVFYAMAERFIEKNVSDRKQSSKIIKLPSKQQQALSETGDDIWELAASTTSEEDQTDNSDKTLFLFGNIVIDEFAFELFEDYEGRVFLLGAVPENITHLRLRDNLHQVTSTAENNLIQIEGIGRIEVEQFLKKQDGDPVNHKISFASF